MTTTFAIPYADLGLKFVFSSIFLLISLLYISEEPAKNFAFLLAL